MRLFQIQADKNFVEFTQTPFREQHDESVLEDWYEKNPNSILDNGGVLLIGRQEPTNLDGYIDLLGLDRQGNVVVVELKRDRTPRDAISQALEYASFAADLDAQRLEAMLRSYRKNESLNLTEFHRKYFNFDHDDIVSFNEDQRIVIVGQQITPGIKQTVEFLNTKGLRVTCVEFTLFKTITRIFLCPSRL